MPPKVSGAMVQAGATGWLRHPPLALLPRPWCSSYAVKPSRPVRRTTPTITLMQTPATAPAPCLNSVPAPELNQTLVLAPVPFSAPKLTVSPDPALPPAPAVTLHAAPKTALLGWDLQQSPAHHCTYWRTSFKALPPPIPSTFSFCSPSVPTASFSFRF